MDRDQRNLKFDGTRRVENSIGGVCLVFFSSYISMLFLGVFYSIQFKFVLTIVEALFPFFRTANEAKMMHTVNQNMGKMMDVHRLIWPGEEVHLRKHKFAKGEGGRHQDYWFRESTMPTSLFIAFMVFALHNKHRAKLDRACAARAFTQTCISTCAAWQGMSLNHIQFGSDHRNVLTIGMNGVIDSALLVWTEPFYVRFVRKHWESDFGDKTKTWITSPSGLTNVTFAELVLFCLDPQHPNQLRNLLMECACSLMSQFALLLDEQVGSLQREVEDINAVGHAGVKNRTRHATVIKTVWVELAARKIWNGEDPGSEQWGVCFFRMLDVLICASNQGTPKKRKNSTKAHAYCFEMFLLNCSMRV